MKSINDNLIILAVPIQNIENTTTSNRANIPNSNRANIPNSNRANIPNSNRANTPNSNRANIHNSNRANTPNSNRDRTDIPNKSSTISNGQHMTEIFEEFKDIIDKYVIIKENLKSCYQKFVNEYHLLISDEIQLNNNENNNSQRLHIFKNLQNITDILNNINFND